MTQAIAPVRTTESESPAPRRSTAPALRASERLRSVVRNRLRLGMHDAKPERTRGRCSSAISNGAEPTRCIPQCQRRVS